MALQFQANLLIKGQIYCETGMHIGGMVEGIEIGGLENIIIRDSRTNVPYIPGSSLKGKLRMLLELSDKEASKNIIESKKNKGEACKCGKCIPCKIFGKSAPEQNENTEGKQQGPTRLIVRDCYPVDKNIETEWKYENTIDRITSAANPRSKERVPRGSVFNFEMVFSVYDNEDYSNFKNIFQCMRLLEDSYLGGSGTRGYGQIRFEKISIIKRKLEYYIASQKEIQIDTNKTVSDILNDQNFANKITGGENFEKKGN